ncbi:nonribosomal peptide synthase SidD [Elsinoe ampelina]|uniref:Nonribosomal peptide synthase SidD n=1 Tax=Elsinoe ampelina TaxID=302913 RepID=A0A6A6G4W3_9PEZI|nr:nonribosomal peptide synthase SidD [Elsinoe ampelina]
MRMSTGSTMNLDADGSTVTKHHVSGFSQIDIPGSQSPRVQLLLLAWLSTVLRSKNTDDVEVYWTIRTTTYSHHYETTEQVLHAATILDSLESRVEEAAKLISGVGLEPIHPSERLVRLKTFLNPGTDSDSERQPDLEVTVLFEQDDLDIDCCINSHDARRWISTHYVHCFLETLESFIKDSRVTLAECLRCTDHDMTAIWSWNKVLPDLRKLCMQDIIADQAADYPNKPAIDSWDGRLTYAEVDLYSSYTATMLVARGVQPHSFVPICFEKSKWATVAILAVMKAGATFVMVDPSLPLTRLQNIATQVNAEIVIASVPQQDFARSILPDGQVITLSDDTFNNPLLAVEKLPTVDSSTIMYLIFTSGSTGTPKGVMISHETYTSSAFPRAKAVGYNASSRVLDFASYAFDVSIDSMLLTLANGGCLCIPSDQERMDDINGVIRRMQVNYAGLTPSVARILDLDVIASMQALGLGGEPSSVQEVNHWGQYTRIVIGYGPCECTIGCTVNSSAATARDYISVGPGNGAAIWIVDPDDHEVLVPVGAVGEILVEGPIVGQGYLNDKNKTSSVFIDSPSWLMAGHGTVEGRISRLYKTGDLGKYDPDGSGSIVFVGRKDTQVKLRGQRVELGEIESQLRSSLGSDMGVVVDIISGVGTGTSQTLVAFVTSKSRTVHSRDEVSLSVLDHDTEERLSAADKYIRTVLPRYMIPVAYIPVTHIPALISGKVDRKQLKQVGALVDLQKLGQSSKGREVGQAGEQELLLRSFWAKVLDLDETSIQGDANFFSLGGDSVTAMKLSSMCRADGLTLSVSQVVTQPSLSNMANCLSRAARDQDTPVKPFSLLSRPLSEACKLAARICNCDAENIHDIYPCTPTQESLFTFSLKSEIPYVAQRIARIPDHIGTDDWKAAWDAVVREVPVLRTRVAQVQESGLQQIVLGSGIQWHHASSLSEYLQQDRETPMDLGQKLARFAIIEDAQSHERQMVWTIHHVVYDGWSEPLILGMVESVLTAKPLQQPTQMKHFVRHVGSINDGEMREFWRNELAGAIGPQFPPLPHRDYVAHPSQRVEREILISDNLGPYTLPVLIRGAWALVTSRFSGNHDVVFGETLAGRDISLMGAESIIGPMIATIPIRVKVDWSISVEDHLKQIQRDMASRSPYQHMGMQNIRKVSPDAQIACGTGTGLVIQLEPKTNASQLGFESSDPVVEALHFNPYPLMLACGICQGGFRVIADFDDNLVNLDQMERMLSQLEVACHAMIRNHQIRLGEIDYMPEQELDRIWKWNAAPPLQWYSDYDTFGAAPEVLTGSSYPQTTVPWVCQLDSSSRLALIGTVGALWLEAAQLPGQFVDTPAWLKHGSDTVSGRDGRMYPTSDIVRLNDDGSLTFIRRREEVLQANGYSIDVGQLHAYALRYLGSSFEVLVGVHCDRSTKIETLIMLVGERSRRKPSGETFATPTQIDSPVSSPRRGSPLSTAELNLDLIQRLRDLDQAILDSLPPYMVPYTYVRVDTLPSASEMTSQLSRNELISRFSSETISKIRQNLTAEWGKLAAAACLSAEQRILRTAWSVILGVTEDSISLNDNFFRMGGDSVLAMKLVSLLRSQGYSLSVADIFQHMRLQDAARQIRSTSPPKTAKDEYVPLSLIPPKLRDHFQDIFKPKIDHAHWIIRDISPVSDSQALDIRATVESPCTSYQYTILRFSQDIDRGRLTAALQKLIQLHEILRTVFFEYDSVLYQAVLDHVQIPVTECRTPNQDRCTISEMCREDIDLGFELGSPFTRLRICDSGTGPFTLIIGLSHAQYDGVSLPMLLKDLADLYSGSEPSQPRSFVHYMARILSPTAQAEAISYWRSVLMGSQVSVLPASGHEPSERAVFKSSPVRLGWENKDTTQATLLCSAWALVLSRRIAATDITFSFITSGRTLLDTGESPTAGPCYQFTPLRVHLDSHWKASNLLRTVQKQMMQSQAYDYLGFEKLKENCTSWPDETKFFDSVVHYQDAGEDYDEIDFAGTNCQVDAIKPHGDSARPWKIVSFVKGGTTHVGVVGGEENEVLVGELLEEMVQAMTELSL